MVQVGGTGKRDHTDLLRKSVNNLFGGCVVVWRDRTLPLTQMGWLLVMKNLVVDIMFGTKRTHIMIPIGRHSSDFGHRRV